MGKAWLILLSRVWDGLLGLIKVLLLVWTEKGKIEALNGFYGFEEFYGGVGEKRGIF